MLYLYASIYIKLRIQRVMSRGNVVLVIRHYPINNAKANIGELRVVGSTFSYFVAASIKICRLTSPLRFAGYSSMSRKMHRK